MDKSIKISMLLEIYGKLLTEKQAYTVELYYNQNLSLSDIADEVNITRQAVRKNLVEAEKNLFEYENKLNLFAKSIQRKEKIDEILKLIEDEKIRSDFSERIFYFHNFPSKEFSKSKATTSEPITKRITYTTIKSVSTIQKILFFHFSEKCIHCNFSAI